MAQSSEVVIVGGGVAGCATAYYLSLAGVKATIIEREGISSQASGFSARRPQSPGGFLHSRPPVGAGDGIVQAAQGIVGDSPAGKRNRLSESYHFPDQGGLRRGGGSGIAGINEPV